MKITSLLNIPLTVEYSGGIFLNSVFDQTFEQIHYFKNIGH